MCRIKILHTVPNIGKSSFGLGQISVSLAKSQYELDQKVSIWCLDTDENIKWASEMHGFSSGFINTFKLVGPKNLLFSVEIKRKARQTADGAFDIIHQHGIWTGVSSATLIFSQLKNIPTVIAPHGSLNKWALNLSSWKKKIALAAYERENLKLASCLHATSESEISDFRDFGLKNPIAYIENGIPEKSLSLKGNAKQFRVDNGIPNDRRILLFLSRISPKKGLKMLVEAVNSISYDFEDWQLIIAGVDEFNHKKDIQSLITELNMTDKIKIIGPLFDQAKNDAFSAAELFILPSYSEGSPMVVLDSLASGVPVITTKASSWSDLEEYNCGWWTEISTIAIARALKKAVIMPAKDLKQMGEQGQILIASKYSWPKLARKTLILYDWLLKRGDKPDFIILD
jgi:glycosyltransferase involved in cell wall biosynthesis